MATELEKAKEIVAKLKTALADISETKLHCITEKAKSGNTRVDQSIDRQTWKALTGIATKIHALREEIALVLEEE